MFLTLSDVAVGGMASTAAGARHCVTRMHSPLESRYVLRVHVACARASSPSNTSSNPCMASTERVDRSSRKAMNAA